MQPRIYEISPEPEPSGFRRTEIKVKYDEPLQMAGLAIAEDEVLFDLDDLYRLHLGLVKRMRLILYLMEIYIHKIYASDIAVPRSPVVQLH